MDKRNVIIALKVDRASSYDTISYQEIHRELFGVLVERKALEVVMNFVPNYEIGYIKHISTRFIPWTNILYIEYPDDQEEHAEDTLATQ